MAAPRRTGATEAEIGLATYATTTPGLGGRLKVRLDDFVVDEVAAPPMPDPAGAYTAARVRLVNWETNAFVRDASRRLGVSRKKIHYSGVKDKRGVTEQWFTFEAPPADVRALSGGGVEVLEAVRTRSELKLGGHAANRFRLVLRDLALGPSEAAKRIEATWAQLAAIGGAPNVFGPQRFGARRATTHRVGERLVRGDLLGAVQVYLADPTAVPDAAFDDWARRLEAADWKGLLALLERGDASIERALLHRLAETGDPREALLVLSPNLQRLFVHALQSWLFNQVVSRRLTDGLGLDRPHVGDLAAPIEDGQVEETWVPVQESNRSRVEAELRRGRAALTGLLPGTEAPFAEGAMGAIERAVLEEAALRTRDFLIPENLEWSSKGTRRALVAPVRGFEFRCREDEVHPGRAAAEFSFELPPGAYATSVLREFMKTPRLEDFG
jgi:tRNA pseudouridine13 synthase